MRVDDPDALPLSNSATADPNDRVIGLDFSGGMASVVSQLSAALGTTGLQFSNPVRQYAAHPRRRRRRTRSTSMRSRRPTPSPALTGGVVGAAVLRRWQRALYRRDHVDGLAERSASPDASRSMRACCRPVAAGRVPDHAVDGVRRCDAPEFPLRPAQQRRAVVFAADPASAPRSAPFSGSIHSFMRQVISQQGEAAEAAANLKQGQDVVFNALQQRFNDGAAVNIDQEMAQPAQPAECLRRQCARADDGQGNARHAVEDVRSP